MPPLHRPPLLIRGARVYDPDGDRDRPPVRDVAIEDGCILAVLDPQGPPSDAVAALQKRPDLRVLEAHGKLMLPGLVNAHYHSYDVLAKGRFEDMPFDVWALHSQPAYWGKRSRAELRARTILGALECLRHGITAVQDMNSLVPQDEETLDTILAAYADVGIRVVFSIALRDVAALDIAPFLAGDLPADVRALVDGAPGDARRDLAFVEAQIKRLRPLPSRLHWALSASGPQRCTRPLLEGLGDLAERHELPFFTHVYETRAQLAKARASYPEFGGSLVRYMVELGLLGPRTALAHGVYLAQDEIEAIAAAQATLVHNPLANLKLKNGIAPLLAFSQAGVRLALGCDNCSCSDTQNMFQAMKMYALLAAGTGAEPSGIGAAEALAAATTGGARAVGLGDRIGAIKPGMAADLVLVDLADLAYQPFNSAVRQLVYCETGRGVDTVLVDGEIVVAGGHNLRIDEAAFRAELADIMQVVDRDFAALAARQRPAIGPLLDANRRLATEAPIRF